MTIEGDVDAQGSDDEVGDRVHVRDGRRAARGDSVASESPDERPRDHFGHGQLVGDDRVLALLPFSHLFGLVGHGQRAAARRRAR